MSKAFDITWQKNVLIAVNERHKNFIPLQYNGNKEHKEFNHACAQRA